MDNDPFEEEPIPLLEDLPPDPFADEDTGANPPLPDTRHTHPYKHLLTKGNPMKSSPTPTRRVADIIPPTTAPTPMEKLQNQELVLVDATPQTTQFGEGYLLKVVDEQGMPYNILTSAIVVCRQIRDLITSGEKLEGLGVTFVKEGKCWVIQ